MCLARLEVFSKIVKNSVSICWSYPQPLYTGIVGEGSWGVVQALLHCGIFTRPAEHHVVNGSFIAVMSNYQSCWSGIFAGNFAELKFWMPAVHWFLSCFVLFEVCIAQHLKLIVRMFVSWRALCFCYSWRQHQGNCEEGCQSCGIFKWYRLVYIWDIFAYRVWCFSHALCSFVCMCIYLHVYANR